MKRLLVISPDDTVVARIEKIVGKASAEFDQVRTWEEGRDCLIDRQYSATVLDSQLLDLGQPRAFVQLNDILTKESTRAVVLSRDNSDQLTQYIEHLDAFDAPLDATLLEQGKGNQRILDLLDAARTLADQSSGVGLERSTGSDDKGSLEGPIELQLPPLPNGSLEDVSLASLLHALHVRESTGLLTLKTNQMTRRIALRDGDILDAVDDGLASLDQIPAIFAWSNGEYSVQPKLLEGAGLTPVYDVIAEGVFNHMDQRRLMDEMMEFMDDHVARTEEYDRWHSDEGPGGDIERFLESVDGRTTLEEILSRVQGDTRNGFQAAYVALRTHRAVVADRPMASPVAITYEHESPDAESPTDEATQSAGLGAASSSVIEESEPECDPEKLEGLLDRAEDANAYELLGAWEGCGQTVVRDRFIPMVKKYHPDRFGDSLTTGQKELAQDLFMRIQDARAELIKEESEQTEPEPTPPPTSVLNDEQPAGPRKKKEQSRAAQPNPDPNESGVIGLGGRSDVDDFAREMGHRESSTGTDEQREEPRRETDEAIALGASTDDTGDEKPSESSGDQPDPGHRETEEIALGDESSASLETEDIDHEAEEGEDQPPGSRLEREADRLRHERDGKVEQLRQNTSTSNLSGGSSSSARTPKHTPRPSLGSPPTTDKQARNHFNFGYKALKAQNEETALEHLKLAHDYDPENGLYKTFYGYALFQAQPDMRDEAEELLEDAIEIEHRQALPDAHLFLGRILRVKGDHAKAKRHFKESLDLNPDSKAAQRELRLYEIRNRKSGDSSDAESDEDVSFKDDPAGYLKNLFNRDLF